MIRFGAIGAVCGVLSACESAPTATRTGPQISVMRSNVALPPLTVAATFHAQLEAQGHIRNSHGGIIPDAAPTAPAIGRGLGDIGNN